MAIERKYFGNTYYICLSSKAELISADEDVRIPLSVTEYKILSYFIDHADTPVYLEELARFVWGSHADEKDPNSLKSQISRVRSKLDKLHSGLRNCIDTNYGLNSYTLKTTECNVPSTNSLETTEATNLDKIILSGIDLFEQERFEEAFALFKKAALMNNSEAAYRLGYCYRFGKGITQDHFQAVKWFDKAASQGNANAQYFLSICYYMGQAVSQDYKKAFEYASLAAAQGHADAQAKVANCYWDGKGVETNRNLAISLFEKAVRMGSTYAATRLKIETEGVSDEVEIQNDTACITSKAPNVDWQHSELQVRQATYFDLVELGYSNLDIAAALVKNDLKLYKGFDELAGIAPENEGSAIQWAEYLSSVPDSFQYILNTSNQIVGNFSFLSISSDQETAFKEGKLSESLFNPAETRDLFCAGDDHILFLLNLSLNDEYSTPRNNTLLRKMFLSQLLLFAEEDILFRKIIVNVFKASHEAFYKQWGFSFVKEHVHSGRIYELELKPYPDVLYNQLNKNRHLKDVNERLKEIYG